MRRLHLIYALLDPRSNEIRYIGRSSSGLRRPNGEHSCHCENWRQEVFRSGLRPIVKVVQEAGGLHFIFIDGER